MPPKYPEIIVPITGKDGNAFSIIARVRRALIDGGVSSDEASGFMKEAMSGDYGNVLRTCIKYVTVE